MCFNLIKIYSIIIMYSKKPNSKELDNLIKWGSTRYVCSCGFVTRNKKKVLHLQSNLHSCLSNADYGLVKGTDKVDCFSCGKQITVCGLPVHLKYCLQV
jgi:hypothetical protein